MARYEITRKGGKAKMTIEAEDYDVKDGVITFVRGKDKLMSVPVQVFAYIALLDDSGEWAFEGSGQAGL